MRKKNCLNTYYRVLFIIHPRLGVIFVKMERCLDIGSWVVCLVSSVYADIGTCLSSIVLDSEGKRFEKRFISRREANIPYGVSV